MVKGGRMIKRIERMVQEIDRIRNETMKPNYYDHPALQAASDLLEFAVESLEEGDIKQAESSINMAQRDIDRVKKRINNGRP